VASSRSRTLNFVLAAEAKQVTSAFSKVEKGGDRLAKHTEQTHGRMSRSYAGSAKSALKWGAATIGAYAAISKAHDAIHATEDLAKSTQALHRNLGLTVEEASRWGAVAKARDIDTKSLNLSFTTLSKTVEAALQGDEKRIALFKELGLTQEDLKAGTHDFSGLVTKLADGFGNLAGGTQRQAAAQQLLGRGYQSVLPLFAEGSKSLQEQLKWADQYGVTLTTKTIGPLNELIKSQREMKEAQLGLSVQFTKVSAPAMLELEGAALRVLKVMNDPHLTGEQKWEKIGNIVGPIADKIGDGVTAAIPKIAEGVGEHAPQVAVAFGKGFLAANIWGKLAIGGWLLHKFGGIGAFTALGRRGGAAMGVGLAEGAAAGSAAGGAGASAVGRGGRLGRLPTTAVGPQFRGGRGLTLAPLGPGLGARGAAGVTRAEQGFGRLGTVGQLSIVVTGTAAVQFAGAKGAQALGHTFGLPGKIAGSLLPGGPIGIAKDSGALDTIKGNAKDLNNWIIRTKASAAALNKELATGAHGFGSKGAFSKEQIAGAQATSHAVRTLADNFGFLKNKSALDLRTLNRVVTQNMAAIAVEMKTNPAQGARDATKSFRLAVNNVKALMHDGTISTKKGMREMARLMKSYAAQGSAEAEAGLQTFVPAIKAAMKRGDIATDKGMKLIRDGFAQTARRFGLSPGAAIELANAQTAQSTGVGIHGNKAVGGIANPGSGSRDDHILLDPRGKPVAALSGTEGIVNTPQMAEVNRWGAIAHALGASRWGSLSQLWRSGMTHHAQGGRVGRQVLTGADSPLRRVDQRALDVARKGANSQLGKIDAAQVAADVLGAISGPKGTASFDGVPVAKWIIPELRWARDHGWGGRVTSGWRDPRQIVHGLFATAPQGQSEHQGTQYPHGAVDLSDYASFASIIRGYHGARRLIQLGIDPLHFSGTGHARGGLLSPGQMASLAYKHGVHPAAKAIRMGAIAMRESHGKRTAHNYDPSRDDSKGLWQINVLPNANPRFKSWNLYDPDVNAKAMSILWHASGEGPWGGYPESSFSGWIDDARRGFRRRGGAAGGSRSSSLGTKGTSGSEGPVRHVGQSRPPLDNAFGAAGTKTTPYYPGGMAGFNPYIDRPEAPTAEDYLASAAAQAALTPDTADDIAAAQAAVTYGTSAYQQAIASGDPRKITQAATNLKGWQDALKGLQEAVEANTDQLASAMKDLAAELKRQNDQHDAVQAIGEKTALDMLTGLISGRISARVNARQQARTYGSVARA
jgi:hypothetical protein